jgi:6-phosphogluconolactonase
MAHEALLAHVPVSASQIHRVPTESGDPATVANRYEAEIQNFFNLSANERPRFDLILLGIGSDGHTASLFPNKPAIEETQRLVIATPHGVLPPPVDRITLTLPVLNAARAIAFLVAGADKIAALRAARDDDAGQVPAAGVRPTDGELRWFVDSAAAGEQG